MSGRAPMASARVDVAAYSELGCLSPCSLAQVWRLLSICGAAVIALWAISQRPVPVRESQYTASPEPSQATFARWTPAFFLVRTRTSVPSGRAVATFPSPSR
ncbi:hypothetical protein ACFQ9X_03175 [Catenulispora yoronensis]